MIKIINDDNLYFWVREIYLFGYTKFLLSMPFLLKNGEKMNEVIGNEKVKIESLIYEIRGKQVMLDSDIAKLFMYETKNLNRQVNRNISRFPEEYCFQLSSKEYENLRCQNVTPNNNLIHGGRRYLPFVFTDKGIIMLATVLKSDIAVEMSIRIINAFISMKKYISSSLIEQKYINNLVFKHDEDIKILQESFDKMILKEKNNHIFFEGQIYDAYSKIIDILNLAYSNLIIIDNYLDKSMLDIISNCKVTVILITADKLNNIDTAKYRKQYNNLHIIINKSFHDRFIIINKTILYHLGSSLNSIGYKCFAITKIDDKDILREILKKLKLL